MHIALHSDMHLRKLEIGAEKAPLLVVDNFVANADELVADAAASAFTEPTGYYPGIKQDAVFNRMLIYRRNSLHSGCIDADFSPDPNPLTGRLSINSFIDLAR